MARGDRPIAMAERIRPIEQMLELSEEEAMSPEHLDSQVQKAQEQLLQLQGQLQGASGGVAAQIQEQIIAYTQTLNQAIVRVNAMADQLNNLITNATNSGVDNIPTEPIQTVPTASMSSDSLPR